MRKWRWIIATILLLIIVFGVINWLAYQHAWSFTHATVSQTGNSKSADTFGEKLNILLNGVQLQKNPCTKPESEILETDTIRSIIPLEVWKMDMIPDEKGVVALFHGYGANKQSLLEAAVQFYRLGYTTVLVDFRGAGNSGGTISTVGYKEAEDVFMVYEWIQAHYPETPKTILYGNSMGAAAILRAVGELEITPDAIILECPFGSLYDAVANRFNILGVPSFPSAACLTYWGGYQNKFDGFDFEPKRYAQQIEVPTLLLYGEKDEHVKREEIDAIYNNLKGQKELVLFPELKHESYLAKENDKWFYHVKWFVREQLEGWDRDKPDYVGSEINPADLEAPQNIERP